MTGMQQDCLRRNVQAFAVRPGARLPQAPGADASTPPARQVSPGSPHLVASFHWGLAPNAQRRHNLCFASLQSPTGLQASSGGIANSNLRSGSTASAARPVAPHHRVPHLNFQALFRLPSTAAAAVAQTAKQTDFSGSWVKDKKRSSSMDEALQVMALGGLMRQAVKLVKGLQITQDEDTFSMGVFSYIAWFKVTEKYKLNGEPSSCRRRDLRKGRHQGVASARGDTLQLQLQWAEPYAGCGTDTFSLATPDELHVDSNIQVRGQSVSYKSIYIRKH